MEGEIRTQEDSATDKKNYYMNENGELRKKLDGYFCKKCRHK